MQNYNLTHLKQLESEAIFVLRETTSQFESPALLFPAEKTPCHGTSRNQGFLSGKSSFPFCDTGHNFPETIGSEINTLESALLIVAQVQDSIDRGSAIEEKGKGASEIPRRHSLEVLR